MNQTDAMRIRQLFRYMTVPSFTLILKASLPWFISLLLLYMLLYLLSFLDAYFDS